MIRTVLQTVLLLLVVIASVEGTIDRASAGHPHGGEATHQLADFDPHEHAGTSDSDDESTGSHCEHCCHGHSSGITSVAATKPMGMLGSCAEIGYDERIVVRAQAPPTPPPNA